MNLPESDASDSPHDRYCTEVYGHNNYEKWWDEAEVRGITNEQLEAENIAYDQLRLTYLANRAKRQKTI